MKVSKVIELAHLWLGLALGVQVLLWMASGVVMTVFELRLVRGESFAVAAYAPELEARSYASPGGIIAQAPGATSLRLKYFLGRPVYEVAGASGTSLFDASSGERITPLPEETIREIARRDFVGDGEIAHVELLTAPPQEYGRKGPVWRATFTDDLKTHLYISPSTGEVEARRNRIWRLYDFFWMLHIMDYEDRKNFNNPLVQTASITGLLFAASGIYLVIVHLMRGRYRIGRRRKGGNAVKPGGNGD